MNATIIVPLDRSPLAERVLPRAESLAKQIGARIVLLSVIDVPFEYQAWLEATSMVDVKIEAENDYEEYLSKVARDIEGVQVDTLVRLGSPETEIRELAHSLPNAIVIMTSHGRTGFRQWVLGSVTKQIVQRIRTPVVVVPASSPDRPESQSDTMQRILVPLDGSPFAEHALDTTLKLFASTRPEILLLRVIELVNWYGDAMSVFDYYGLDPYIDAARETAGTYLQDMSLRVQDQGFTVFSEVQIGRVANEIHAMAERNDVDMIIMATHGRGGVSKLILGSVAEQTLQQSTVPLMLIHPEGSAQESEEVTPTRSTTKAGLV